MDARRVAAILIAACNDLVEKLEEEMTADKEDGGEDKPTRRERPSRAKADDGDDDPPRRSRAKPADDDGDGDEPSEDDIAKATRAALKVLEQDDVVAIIKKHGRANRATEVKPALRQKVIDALEKAVDEAND